MMDEKQKKEFAKYLKNLRERRGMGHNDVEQATKELFPDHKEFQITSGYMSLMENAKNFPSAYKVKALSKVYGESTGKMLFVAGYLDEDPFSAPPDWSKDTLRDYYISCLTPPDMKKNLSGHEKDLIENAIQEIINELYKERQNENRPRNLDLFVFRNLYLDHLAHLKKRRPLNSKQKKILEKLIDEYIMSFSKEKKKKSK